MASDLLQLERFHRSRRQISYTATVRGLRFSTSFWYDSVDLFELESRYGESFLHSIYLHLVAFDLDRLVSLAPRKVDFGPLSGYVTEPFFELWRRIVHGVWAQWRYENDRPEDRGPSRVRGPEEPFGTDPGAVAPVSPEPVRVEPGEVASLAFCGGGKDSLVALRLLEEIGEPYESLVYSHSHYGGPEHQHRLVDELLAHCAPRRRHRVWIFDDFLSSPVVALEGERLGIGSLTAAETPASLFLALPLALAHGLTDLVLAHEKSADRGNLVWEATGEEVNHQWGKSLEAEELLAEYVREHLISNLEYYSLLKPVQDAVIFGALADYPDALAATHSCNERKPWCYRCAKCAYVWLSYFAYLPRETVESLCPVPVFDLEANQRWFRQLLGLEEHTPFECVGQIEESRLAFELCRRKGLSGRAIETYREAFPEGIDAESVAPLFEVAGNPHRIPQRLAAPALEALEAKAEAGRRYVARWLS